MKVLLGKNKKFTKNIIFFFFKGKLIYEVKKGKTQGPFFKQYGQKALLNHFAR